MVGADPDQALLTDRLVSKAAVVLASVLAQVLA